MDRACYEANSDVCSTDLVALLIAALTLHQTSVLILTLLKTMALQKKLFKAAVMVATVTMAADMPGGFAGHSRVIWWQTRQV